MKLARLDKAAFVRVNRDQTLARIPVGDRWTLVDAADAPKLIALSAWSLRRSSRNGTLYVQASEGIHRLLMAAKPGDVVDHINGDTLDNRRCNLRITDRRGNARNVTRSKNQRRGGYKGVSWCKKANKWQVVFGGGKTLANGKAKLVHVGMFKSAEVAARAYDVAAKKAFGEFASLNFPEGS